MTNETETITGDVLEELKKKFTDVELEKEKAKAFDHIGALFFNRNFGAVSKAEIELNMFSIFMDWMIDIHKNENGVLDYNACSDFRIAKMLGLTEERVRTLKVKKQARFPKEFQWKDSLLALKEEIVFDEVKKKFIIPIRDPNLYNEIRNAVADNGGYDDVQRGRNFIQMRPNSFFMLIYAGIESVEEKKRVREEFVKMVKEKNEKEKASFDDVRTDKELADFAWKYADNIFEILEDIATVASNPFLGIVKGVRVATRSVNHLRRNVN